MNEKPPLIIQNDQNSCDWMGRFVMAKENSLKTKIYTNVFESILKGEYRTEDVIIEKNLVEKYNVSKSPVREALIELCNEGVLRSIPRYGYEVIRLTDRDLDDIRDFRLILECGCLAKYWDMITAENIKALEDSHAHYPTDLEYDAIVHWQNNSIFHLKLISFYSNEYIYSSLKQSLRTLSRAYAQFHWDKWHKIQFISVPGRHYKFIEYLKDNNKEAALKCLEEDIAGFNNLEG